mgnify:FL=1
MKDGIPKNNHTRVVVGISGGVDSSVAAWQLKEQGFDVLGLFMKNWEEDDNSSYCNSTEDLEFAAESCEKIGITLKTINFSHEYWERVFKVFLAEYKKGHTPNPDVLCNKEIKFREFLDFADYLGAEFIATGHYARTQKLGSFTQLLKGVDKKKDQSYFLHQISQSALARTLFPLGNQKKTDIRKLANALELPNAKRKDSTGICFIGERRFKNFLARYLPKNTGEIRSLTEKPLGEHDGLWFYTLGQRRGLNIGGPGEAWYVAKKDVLNNVLYVVQGHNNLSLMNNHVRCIDPHWIIGKKPDLTTVTCSAKIRYSQDDEPCHLLCEDTNYINVSFLNPQRAVTPGQSLVLYDGDIVLGGATISSMPNETRCKTTV